MMFADFNTMYLLITDGENLQIIFAVPKDESPLPFELEKEALELAPNIASALIADGTPVQYWGKCLVPVRNQIPKQVTKAPSGAAVSSMPLHEVAIPLDKSITAQYMADHARSEFYRSLMLAKESRVEGDRETAVFLLNDAGAFRRIHREFTLAVEFMGGL